MAVFMQEVAALPQHLRMGIDLFYGLKRPLPGQMMMNGQIDLAADLQR